MPLLQSWYPPTTRGHYELILFCWQLFPLAASLQWVISWYGMGKTSVQSRLNIPGRIAWITMESPGFLTLVYTMYMLSTHHAIEDLPWQNKVLGGLFVLHYLYRALLYPLIQPYMSPIHVIVWAAALLFQLLNALSLGAWLGAYGPVTAAAWESNAFSTLQFVIGIAVFYLGLVGNYIHDDELREIRRDEQRRQAKLAAGVRKDVQKHYRLPTAAGFRYMLYPHYFLEWVEWFGFWMACGFGCAPARAFLLNEIASMLPRAVRGRKWYADQFGEDKIRRKWTIIPGVL